MSIRHVIICFVLLAKLSEMSSGSRSARQWGFQWVTQWDLSWETSTVIPWAKQKETMSD